MKELTFEHKKAWVMGLFLNCPFCETLDGCPAEDAKSLPIRDRIQLVRSMDEIQLDEILAHHRICLHEREWR